MAYIFTSEYVGDENRRSAQVFKLSNGTGYAVQCFENQRQIREEIFLTESQADSFAEDWVDDSSAAE
jgi:hypothetical protein